MRDAAGQLRSMRVQVEREFEGTHRGARSGLSATTGEAVEGVEP
jgi:hypothetical protein